VVKSRNAVALLFTAIAVTNLYAVFGAGGVLGNRPFTEAMGMFRSRNLIFSLITSNKAH
jgi:hypothetical protein